MASVSIDKRNGRVVVKVYAGKDPATGRQRYLRKAFDPGTPKAKIDRAVDELTARAAELRGAGAVFTLDDLYCAFEANRRERRERESTTTTYRSRYRLISAGIGKLAVDEVRPTDVARALGACVSGDGRTVSPRTANYALALLSEVFTWGQAFDLAHSNPAAAVKPLKGAKGREVEGSDLFSSAEVGMIEAWARGGVLWDEVCYRTAALLALHTGMRAGEVCALTVEGVGRGCASLAVTASVSESGGLHVGPTKSGRPRTLALDREAAAHLEWFLARRADIMRDADDPGYLICDADGSLRRPRAVSSAFALGLAELGIDHGRFHSLRHTHASMLAWGGVSVFDISKRLGHASSKVTEEIYLHVFPARDQLVADAFGKAMGGGHGRA